MEELALSIPPEDVADALARIRKSVSDPVTVCVGFFDLAGSTALKVERGNKVGTLKAMEFVALAELMATKADGKIIKSLGDGLLVTFNDPLGACRAAISIKKACGE